MQADRSERLVIYGTTASQPSRSVYWCCMIKELPFEARDHEHWRDQYRPEFLKINALGLVPAILDNGFALAEMPAILKYLSVRHKWTDFYPEDPHVQALIDQYLSAHHQTSRMATYGLMAKFVCNGIEDNLIAAMEISPSSLTGAGPSPIVPAKYNPQTLEIGQAIVTRLCKLLEKFVFPNDNAFFCGTAYPTIADLAAYEDLAQLPWANLYEFSAFPRIQRWLDEMKQLPFHDAVHEYNFALGDICTKENTLENYTKAHLACYARMQNEGVGVVTTMVPRHS